jgi:hypothetical protein
MTVEVRDLGIGKLKADTETLQRQRVTVGYQGPTGQSKHPHANASVAQVAAWQEFGTPGSDDRQYDMPRGHIPSRPFVRTGLAKYSNEIADAIKNAFRRLLSGDASVDEAQAGVGERMVEAVQQSILDARSWAKPLAGATIKSKGHDDPLIESGALYDATSYAVRDGDKILRTGGAK